MVLELTADNFDREVLESSLPVIVDFWASWCGPCRMLAPVYEQVSKEFFGKIKFTKLSTEEFPDIANEHEVMGIPCLLVFHQGKEIERIVGFHQAPQLKQKIEDLLKKI